MERLWKHLHFLRYLSVTTAHQRRQLLSGVTTEQINAIVEIAYNLLQGNIDLSETEYLSLCKFKSIIRKLVTRETAAVKRQVIFQHSSAIQELIRVFLNCYSLESDSTEDDDDDTQSAESSSESSDTELWTDANPKAGVLKNDGTERCQKTNFDSSNKVPSASANTDTVKTQPFHSGAIDGSTRLSSATESCE